MSMNYKFYIGEGEKARAMFDEMLADRNFASIYRNALIELTGAENLFYYAAEPDRPRGFVFAEQKDRPGLKFGAAVDGGFTYFPDRETSDGQHYEELLSDAKLRFDAELDFLRQLGVKGEAYGYCHHCRNAHAVYRPRVFWVSGQYAIFLKIPETLDPYPELPAWIQEVKESEWLARQGK